MARARRGRLGDDRLADGDAVEDVRPAGERLHEQPAPVGPRDRPPPRAPAKQEPRPQWAVHDRLDGRERDR